MLTRFRPRSASAIGVARPIVGRCPRGSGLVVVGLALG